MRFVVYFDSHIYHSNGCWLPTHDQQLFLRKELLVLFSLLICYSVSFNVFNTFNIGKWVSIRSSEMFARYGVNPLPETTLIFVTHWQQINVIWTKTDDILTIENLFVMVSICFWPLMACYGYNIYTHFVRLSKRLLHIQHMKHQYSTKADMHFWSKDYSENCSQTFESLATAWDWTANQNPCYNTCLLTRLLIRLLIGWWLAYQSIRC